jgi:hypothetical protein
MIVEFRRLVVNYVFLGPKLFSRHEDTKALRKKNKSKLSVSNFKRELTIFYF